METCRTCARWDFENGNNWLDLFHPTRWQSEIAQIRLEFVNWKMKISSNDGLPQKICSDCFTKFCTIFTFRLSCQDAQLRLRNIFDKIETETLDDEVNNEENVIENDHNNRNNDDEGIISLKHNEEQPTTTTTTTTAQEIPLNDESKSIAETKDKIELALTLAFAPEELIIEEDEYAQDNNNENEMENSLEYQVQQYHDDDNDDIVDHVDGNNICSSIQIDNISYSCEFCFKTKQKFDTQDSLLKHITSLHDQQQPYTCPECNVGFQDAASRTVHIKNDHVEKHYACNVCGKKYSDRFNLRHHVEKYHSETDFECKLCEKRFFTRKSLNYHMKWHNPERQFKCTYCDRLFINQRHLKCHEVTHTGIGRRNEYCSFCGKAFIHLKTLRWHIYRQHGGEKPFKCGNCTEVFASYVEKRIHMLAEHRGNLTAIERSECMICRERFSTEEQLSQHMESLHLQRINQPLIENNKRVLQQKREKQYSGLLQCDACGQRFNMKSALERHAAVHSTEGRPHACSQCSKRFKRPQDMKWHMKTHAVEKSNICDVCGKGFALKYVLTQHKRSHEVLEKNFKCLTCGRAYLFEKSLRLHERTHTGKTFYKCDFCGERFVTHIKLKCHMQKIHHHHHHHNHNHNDGGTNNSNKMLPLDDLINIVMT